MLDRAFQLALPIVLLRGFNLALSIFATVLFLWLGLMIFLSGERRSAGTRVASLGLLMGGLFMLSHTVILSEGLAERPTLALDAWWTIAWVTVITTPAAWYMAMVWYTGRWGDYTRRHFVVSLVAVGAGVLIVLLALVSNPFPRFTEAANFEPRETPLVFGIPLILWLFVPYMILCFSLPIHALTDIGPGVPSSRRSVRERARPWLIAVSMLMALVGLVTAWGALWIWRQAQAVLEADSPIPPQMWLADSLALFLIANAVMLLGYAVVHYEVFTERPLPRRGVFRRWRGTVLLAALFAGLLAANATLGPPSSITLIIALALASLMYALLAWLQHAEYEAFMRRLRPFVTGPALTERLLAHTADEDAERAIADLEASFLAVCRDTLGVTRACLLPVGVLAIHRPRPLCYAWPTPPAVDDLYLDPDEPYTRLDPESLDGARWAIALTGEHGLKGVLVLGAKIGGGEYSAEEMDIAQAFGERVLDALLAMEVTHVLTGLVRQRIAEVRVLSNRQRRVLHDEVLPQIHLALLNVGDAGPPGVNLTPEAVETTTSALIAAHRTLSDLIRETQPATPHRLVEAGLPTALREAVERDFEGVFAQVAWEIDDAAAEQTNELSEVTLEVAYFAALEAVRNAARHASGGDPTRMVSLRIRLERDDDLWITIQDDGVGPGVRARVAQGRAGILAGTGSGLLFHRTMLGVLGGTLEVSTAPGGGALVRIGLP